MAPILNYFISLVREEKNNRFPKGFGAKHFFTHKYRQKKAVLQSEQLYDFKNVLVKQSLYHIGKATTTTGRLVCSS
jgi:hypothetical protein